MERIDINERLFAVKLEPGWAVCMKWEWNYDEKDMDEEDFQLIYLHPDLSIALKESLKRIEEYSFKLYSKMSKFVKEISDGNDLNIEIDKKSFENCSQVCHMKSDKEFPYALMSNEILICHG